MQTPGQRSCWHRRHWRPCYGGSGGKEPSPLLARVRQSILAWVRPLAAAALLGAASGLACTGVRLGFRGLQWCFTGHSGLPPEAAVALPLAYRAGVPVLGGLLATLVLRFRDRAGSAAPYVDYVEAVQREGGVIPLAPNVWRTLSSAFSVATGAAVGREGSMIQFGTACASTLGQKSRTFAGWRAVPLPDMVAFGVAAGVAAAYQAPVAGVFFASEIALGRTEWRRLPLLAAASSAGWLVSRPLLGPGPLFMAPAALGPPTGQWCWLLLLAPLFGALGPLYQWLIRSLQAVRRFPFPLVCSGVVVGLLSLWAPTVWGNGDGALLPLVHAGSGAAPSASHTATVLAFRLLATCFCVGAGVVGGVFTPTLFAGASLGLLFADAGRVHPALLFVLAGLSFLLSAVTHAPVMAACMAAELTGRWELAPLLLAGNFLAFRTAARISSHSLYAIATSSPNQAPLPAAKHPPRLTRRMSRQDKARGGPKI